MQDLVIFSLIKMLLLIISCDKGHCLFSTTVMMFLSVKVILKLEVKFDENNGNYFFLLNVILTN